MYFQRKERYRLAGKQPSTFNAHETHRIAETIVVREPKRVRKAAEKPEVA